MNVNDHWELLPSEDFLLAGLQCNAFLTKDIWEDLDEEGVYRFLEERIEITGNLADPVGLKIGHTFSYSDTVKEEVATKWHTPTFGSKDDVVKAIKDQIEKLKRQTGCLETMLILASSATSFETNYVD